MTTIVKVNCILMLLIAALTVFAQQAKAAMKWDCQASRTQQTYALRGDTVEIRQQFDEGPNRAISSQTAGKTFRRGNSVKYVFVQDNVRHTLHLADVNSPGPDDYLQLRNHQGHTMSYPVDCKKKL